MGPRSIALVVLLTPTLAAAEEVDLTPFPRGVTLRGAVAETVTTLAFDAPAQRRTEPIVRLRWTASSLLDLRASTLTLELDQRPLRSVRLEAVEHGRLDVPLDGVPAGFHALRIRVRLVIDDDPCAAQLEEARWLQIESASAVHWTRLPGPPAPLQTIAELLEAWRLEPDIGVRLVVPPGPEPALSSARLEAWMFLHALGLSRSDAADARRVALEISPRLEGPAALGLEAEVLRSGSDLVVRAATYEGIAGGLRALRDEARRARCKGARCAVGIQLGVPEAEARSPEAGPTMVLAPQGFVARGAGRHELRRVWQRPRAFEAQPWPELRLPVRVSGAAALDREHSHLIVLLGDRPLNQWSLARLDDEALLVTRIPKDAWAAREWDLRVQVRLRSSEHRPCHFDDSEALWVSMGTEAGLFVPGETLAPEGLAGFARRSRETRPVVEIPRALTGAAAARLARVLVPLDQPRARPWRLVIEASECRPRCLRVRDPLAGMRAEPLSALNHNGILQWHDPTGAASLPLVPVRGTVLMALATLPEGERLDLWLPGGSALPAPPPFVELWRDAALWHGGEWQSLGPSPDPAEGRRIDVPDADALDPPPAASDEARMLLGLDIASALLALLLLAGGLRWSRRRRHASPEALQS